jgi:hypothetical protein
MVKEYPNILFYLDYNSTPSGLAALPGALYGAFHDRLFKFKPFGLGESRIYSLQYSIWNLNPFNPGTLEQ